MGPVQTQARIVELLSTPGTYPHDVEEVVRVQTHISHVFLAGAFVYKLKKAVTFPFLDFGTVAARERFCREELRLNRRLAAPVYLDVIPVMEAAGGLRLGGAGSPVDWVVRMRRLPAERALAALLDDPSFDGPVVMRRLAAHLAAFHAAAPTAGGGGPEALQAAWRENLAGVRPMVGSLLTAADLGVLEDFGGTYVVHHDAVLRARVALGHIRDAHGDLRLDHVYVLDTALPALADAPAVPAGFQVVDCIEFAPAFRAVDVAADLSFLMMELESSGRADLARALVDGYAEAADDGLVPALAPFHACHRAIVRGKVEGLAAADAAIDADARRAAEARARGFFALAGRFAWRCGDPVVIACAGLSGTGKSAVAGLIGEATAFTVVSSDVVRRRAGATPHYDPAARAAVYARLRDEVDRALVARESLVVDATFLSRAERDALARVVHGYGRRHVFVACEADEAAVKRRLDARGATSVSDARFDVYLAQKAEHDPFAADEPVLHLDTARPLDAVRADLLPRLWHWRQGRPTGGVG
jgi:hypothetical protein